ncbi:MAG: GNAT family N-acetyltransferase [Novosphingobium sp.]|nr:GNAT family N-acetyltransferase [Novosphingobium sp.]
MTAAPLHSLRFQLGARTPFSVRRRLRRVPLALDEALVGGEVSLPPLDNDDHGYFISSVPLAGMNRITLRHENLKPFIYQDYSRRYVDLTLGFDAYMQGFSSKSRSTLRRKLRKFTELSGGSLDIRLYRSPDELAEFHRLARAISRKTYQERLLDAGLPEGSEFEVEVARLANEDQLRAWILFVHDEPVSYLYAPAQGDTLVYAYLGYDPAFASHSPGAVLQIEALRAVMEEGAFRQFDFTEGDGQHKRQFATGSIDCVDLLLLRPSLSNRLTVAALSAFYGTIALAKSIIPRKQVTAWLRG